jgi:hypothetical protein
MPHQVGSTTRPSASTHHACDDGQPWPPTIEPKPSKYVKLVRVADGERVRVQIAALRLHLGPVVGQGRGHEPLPVPQQEADLPVVVVAAKVREQQVGIARAHAAATKAATAYVAARSRLCRLRS